MKEDGMMWLLAFKAEGAINEQCGQPLEAGKSKQMDSFLEPLAAVQPYQELDLA